MSAIVVRIEEIEKHPNADKLEIVKLSDNGVSYWRVVTGPHYVEGWLGVYCPPGTVLPGYLARDAWLVGDGKYNQWYTVTSKNMRGIESPGVFFCQWYMKDKAPRTVSDLRAEARANLMKFDPSTHADDPIATPIYEWPMWNKRFKLGQDVSAYLGIR